MRFHHMAIIVSDIQEAIRLWRDVMGFELAEERVVPDGDAPGPDVYIYPELMDDIFKSKGSRSKMAMLSSKEGAWIELQEPESPLVERTPPENLRYRHTGFHELGLMVDDIDAYFEKVREAGYETQTEYVWQCANLGRSFLFYDKEGNMIQLWENRKRS